MASLLGAGPGSPTLEVPPTRELTPLERDEALVKGYRPDAVPQAFEERTFARLVSTCVFCVVFHRLGGPTVWFRGHQAAGLRCAHGLYEHTWISCMLLPRSGLRVGPPWSVMEVPCVDSNECCPL